MLVCRCSQRWVTECCSLSEVCLQVKILQIYIVKVGLRKIHLLFDKEEEQKGRK